MKRPAQTLLLILIVVAVFGQIVTHEFVGWDDHNTIQQNPRMLPPTLEGTAWYWAHAAAGLYVPLTYTVWTVLAMVAQTRTVGGAVELNPWVFHAASLFLHVLSAIVVLDILRRLIGRDWPAFVGAVLFALHPMQVESVAWASGLKDVLCGLLALLAIRSYIAFALDGIRPQYALAAVMAILSMLAKPIGFVAPFMMAAIDIWVLRRPIRRILRSVLPLVLITLPLLILARIVQTPQSIVFTPLWTRPLIALDSLGFYLRKLIFPWPLTLTYGRTPGDVISSGVVYYAWIIPLFVAIVLWRYRARIPVLLAAAVIFVVALLPMLGLTNFMMQIHSTVADHYLYLPMFGAAMAAAWVADRLPHRVPAAVVLVLLATLTVIQGSYWRDGISLFGHGVAVDPDNQDALQGLGNALSRANRIDGAIPHFEHAAKLEPQNRLSQELLTQSLVFTGRFEQALPHATEALRLAKLEGETDTAQDEFLLGRTLAALGQLREGETHLAEAARQCPDDNNLAAELDSIRRRLDSPTTNR